MVISKKMVIAGEEETRTGARAGAATLTWTLVALRAATLVMEEAMQAILKSWEVVECGECVQEWRAQRAGPPLGEDLAQTESGLANG
jgi:hypothetical protein